MTRGKMEYYKGLSSSFVAVGVFSILGWIQIEAEYDHLFSLLIIAAVFWTITYFGHYLVARLAPILTSSVPPVGLVIGCVVILCVLTKMIIYTISSESTSFIGDGLQLFIIACIYQCIAMREISDAKESRRGVTSGSTEISDRTKR